MSGAEVGPEGSRMKRNGNSKRPRIEASCKEGIMSRMGFLSMAIAGGALLAWGAIAAADDIPLRRSPGVYHILARKEFKGKNYHLVSQGCNIGVNNCLGRVNGRDLFMADQTQMVSDKCTNLGGGSDVFQLFCNEVKRESPTQLKGVTVRHPGPPADPNFPAESWTCPILADESDATFIAACNALPGGTYPSPFTWGAVDVLVKKGGGDCDCGAVVCDSNPGNNVCDLPAGNYQDVNVRNGAVISFDGGVYNVRRYKNGKDVRMEFKSPTTLNVAGKSGLRFGNGARVIAECGDLRVNYEGTKSINLGRRSQVTMDLCAPFGKLRLGNTNFITGHYFADSISSDRGNRGFCCGGCACFDLVEPNPACVGTNVTLSGGCQLNNIERVLICGIEATIVSKSSTEVVVTVPNVGPPKSCAVDAESVTGVFRNATLLEVPTCP